MRKLFIPLYKIYQQKLLDLNACDFGDLILHTVKILEKNLDIREIYTNNFKYILVDEYQDTIISKVNGYTYLQKNIKIYAVWVMMINQFIAGVEQKLKIF